MSDSASSDDAPERAVLQELEGAVSQALERLAALRERAEAAEAKSEELEEVVRRFTQDEAGGSRLLSRLKRLEDENVDLRRRLEEGREGVDRILARIRFLEEKR